MPIAANCGRLTDGVAEHFSISDFRHALPSLMAAGLLLFIVGCGAGSSAPSKTQTSRSAASAAAARSAVDSQCESVLLSIDDIFQLSRLGRVTAVSDGVARLNDWQRSCGSDFELAPRPLSAEVRKLLTPEQMKALEDRRFTLRDGDHFRDCMLAREVASYAVAAGQTDLERVTLLFGHVVRAVGLVRKPLQNLPLTPYEVYLLGKGTAADRAWIFVNILRQLKLDAVLLFPKTTEAAASDDAAPFLVGVLLDEQVYLFDPRAGVPVPALDDKAGNLSAIHPATLTEALANPSVLKQLDAGKENPYPIVAADLAHPVVAIVGDSSLWSLRMQALQTQFVGNRAMVISEPLADFGEDFPGLWRRTVMSGGEFWDAASMRLWDYPEATLAAHVALSPDRQQTLTGLMKPFEAFLNVVRNRESGKVELIEKDIERDPAAGKYDIDVRMNVRLTVGQQMIARLAHLAGDFPVAVQTYTLVRGRSKDVLQVNPPLAIRSAHTRAIEDAAYWTGLCQYEQGEFKAAANTLARYRKQYETGSWDRESRSMLAQSLAATGDYAAAIGELDPVEPDDLEYAGYRYLIRRWQALQKATSK